VVCSVSRRLAGTRISEVQALRVTCSQAARRIDRGRLLLSPAGPLFAVRGYACGERNLDPVTPAPSQLPQLVLCTAGHRHEFRFIWTWA
jgi:hypothetical protein